jgi:Ca-activated chloride channel family protein
LKTFIHILVVLFSGISSYAQQYYLRGEVKDEAGNILQNVTILQNKTGYVFRSGEGGTFGITSNQAIDTLSFLLEGYYNEVVVVSADDYVRIRLKLLPYSIRNKYRDKLSSLTKNLDKELQKTWFVGDETYASIVENHFVNATKYPSTGVSLNVDRASYSNIRRFITLKSIVPPDAVRIEEMLNYFNLDYHEPESGNTFNIKSKLTSCPWNEDNELFLINLSSKKLNLDTLPPSHLVFLIDISGSMDMPNRLPLLKAAFKLLVNNLREKDSIAIVVYGGLVGTMLNTTSGGEKEKILKVIDELTPGGSTPGESGIRLAYSVARNHFIKGGNNRVILATDGDFNVGLKTEDELDELITFQKQSGIYLTCLGVGMGNYKDSKIQRLAKKGNGNFAYLDNFSEAEKVLLKEFTQTMYAVADNVYMTVDFNKDLVKEYRLIGFDNKVGALRDSLASIDGGEIGSGFSMIALFEIIPTKKNEDAIEGNSTAGKFADIKLEFRHPNEVKKNEFNCSSDFTYMPFEELQKSHQFSVAVAMFGSLLRGSPFSKNITWNDIITLATSASIKNDQLQKEFVSIAQQTKIIYSKKRKKKKAYN